MKTTSMSIISTVFFSLPKLAEDERMFLQTGLAEKYAIERLFSTSKEYTPKERRDDIKKLFSGITNYQERYGFRPNQILGFSGSTMEVPMDLTVFGNDAQKYIEKVESNWNKDAEYKIKIVAETIDIQMMRFLVKVDNVIGERSYVRGQTIQLYNWDEVSTLAHEFGHALGFRDNYYITWDSATCKYKQESNSGDIMSNHSSGKVLPRHWEEIKKNYLKP